MKSEKGKGKITPLSSKKLKRISEKFKNIQCCRSAIPEIRNIPEKETCLKVTPQINSEKQFHSKFNKVAKVADCKITV